MAAATTKQIEIVVNGHARFVPAGYNLHDLLVWLDVDPARVAVEMNRSIIQRGVWAQTVVNDGATLEIVQFVGGG